MNKSQLETLCDNVLSNNRVPLTRGADVNGLIKEIITALFSYKQSFVKTCTNVTSVEVLSTEHLLPSINGVRIEDSNGNEMFIPNKIDRTLNKVNVYPSVSSTFKLILF